MAFINHLASKKATSGTRKRKLASIRGFLKFLKDNQIIYGNPADMIEGPIQEERDPAILLKTEYKALLQVAGEYPRDFAMVMLFLQSGLRVSELVKLKLQDIDFVSHEITVRQGKGRKDHIPSDLVVDRWVSEMKSSSSLDFLFLCSVWTTFGRLMRDKITSVLSMA